MQYNKAVTKKYKSFLATYRPACGMIRVVIVQEPDGCEFFFSTDPEVTVQEILEAFADRGAIEQTFHDIKEVWGAGKQQLRYLWANIGAYHLNLWMHTLVELWAWNKCKGHLCAIAATLRGTIRGAALRMPTVVKPCSKPSSSMNIRPLLHHRGAARKFVAFTRHLLKLAV